VRGPAVRYATAEAKADEAMGFVIIAAVIGLIGGAVHGIRARDEAGVVILKAPGGGIAGFLFTILLFFVIAPFGNRDM
jgi:hypothetical protein